MFVSNDQSGVSTILSLPHDAQFWISAIGVPLALVLIPWIHRHSPERIAENVSNLLLANLGVALLGLVNGAPAALSGVAATQFPAALGAVVLLSFGGWLYGAQVQESIDEVFFWKRVTQQLLGGRYIRTKPGATRPSPKFPSGRVVSILGLGVVLMALTIAIYASALSL